MLAEIRVTYYIGGGTRGIWAKPPWVHRWDVPPRRFPAYEHPVEITDLPALSARTGLAAFTYERPVRWNRPHTSVCQRPAGDKPPA